MLPRAVSHQPQHRPVVHDVVVGGRKARFVVTNPSDVIQSEFVHGVFHEGPYLLDLLDYLPRGAVVLDIGANVGNHTVWFAGFAGASQVIPFELNQPAIDLLLQNIELNALPNVDTSFLGIGCGDAPSTVVIDRAKTGNLGATAFKAAPSDTDAATFKVDSIDRLLPDRRVDLVKIDVEGMELSVLRGMRNLIARCRPQIYVEVWYSSLTLTLRFLDWLAHSGYRVQKQHGPNLLCTAIDDGGASIAPAQTDDLALATFEDDNGDLRRRTLSAVADAAATRWHNPFAIHYAAHVLCHHGEPRRALALVDVALGKAGEQVAFLQTRAAIADKLDDERLLVETVRRVASLLATGKRSAAGIAGWLWQSACSQKAIDRVSALLRKSDAATILAPSEAPQRRGWLSLFRRAPR